MGSASAGGAEAAYNAAHQVDAATGRLMSSSSSVPIASETSSAPSSTSPTLSLQEVQNQVAAERLAARIAAGNIALADSGVSVSSTPTVVYTSSANTPKVGVAVEGGGSATLFEGAGGVVYSSQPTFSSSGRELASYAGSVSAGDLKEAVGLSSSASGKVLAQEAVDASSKSFVATPEIVSRYDSLMKRNEEILQQSIQRTPLEVGREYSIPASEYGLGARFVVEGASLTPLSYYLDGGVTKFGFPADTIFGEQRGIRAEFAENERYKQGLKVPSLDFYSQGIANIESRYAEGKGFIESTPVLRIAGMGLEETAFNIGEFVKNPSFDTKAGQAVEGLAIVPIAVAGAGVLGVPSLIAGGAILTYMSVVPAIETYLSTKDIWKSAEVGAAGALVFGVAEGAGRIVAPKLAPLLGKALPMEESISVSSATYESEPMIVDGRTFYSGKGSVGVSASNILTRSSVVQDLVLSAEEINPSEYIVRGTGSQTLQSQQFKGLLRPPELSEAITPIASRTTNEMLGKGVYTNGIEVDLIKSISQQGELVSGKPDLWGEPTNDLKWGEQTVSYGFGKSGKVEVGMPKATASGLLASGEKEIVPSDYFIRYGEKALIFTPKNADVVYSQSFGTIEPVFEVSSGGKSLLEFNLLRGLSKEKTPFISYSDYGWAKRGVASVETMPRVSKVSGGIEPIIEYQKPFESNQFVEGQTGVYKQINTDLSQVSGTSVSQAARAEVVKQSTAIISEQIPVFGASLAAGVAPARSVSVPVSRQANVYAPSLIEVSESEQLYVPSSGFKSVYAGSSGLSSPSLQVASLNLVYGALSPYASVKGYSSSLKYTGSSVQASELGLKQESLSPSLVKQAVSSGSKFEPVDESLFTPKMENVEIVVNPSRFVEKEISVNPSVYSPSLFNVDIGPKIKPPLLLLTPSSDLKFRKGKKKRSVSSISERYEPSLTARMFNIRGASNPYGIRPLPKLPKMPKLS